MSAAHGDYLEDHHMPTQAALMVFEEAVGVKKRYQLTDGVFGESVRRGLWWGPAAVYAVAAHHLAATNQPEAYTEAYQRMGEHLSRIEDSTYFTASNCTLFEGSTHGNRIYEKGDVYEREHEQEHKDRLHLAREHYIVLTEDYPPSWMGFRSMVAANSRAKQAPETALVAQYEAQRVALQDERINRQLSPMARGR